MADERYLVRMRSWNGHGFDINGKDAKTKKEILGLLSLTLREIRPFQVTITDLNEAPPGYKVVPVEEYDSVRAAAEASDRDQDRISDVIIINGEDVLNDLTRDFQREHERWDRECVRIRGQFRKKTSRSVKSGKEYESTNWYKVKPDGGLESVGKEEPDYSKYYPPEPKSPVSFEVSEFEGHLVLSEKDYIENIKLFKECLAFSIESQRNLEYPLNKKDSVQKGAAISERSLSAAGQKRKTGNRNFDLPYECGLKGGGDCNSCKHDDCPCWNDGDCDSCEHNNECPVRAEECEA